MISKICCTVSSFQIQEEARQALLQGLIENDRQYLLTLRARRDKILHELNTVDQEIISTINNVKILSGYSEELSLCV